MPGPATIGADCSGTACILCFLCSAPSLLSLAALQVDLGPGTIIKFNMTIKPSAIKSRLSFRTHHKYFSLVSIMMI